MRVVSPPLGISMCRPIAKCAVSETRTAWLRLT
jgi:hypothetical protein